MHINMKYYIVSIGAIFIALGIGMLVGFNLNYDQEMSKQQANIISDLDKKFDNLKEKNDTLEQDLDKITEEYNKSIEFIDANFDKILVNELLDKNIGVISTNQSEDYTKDIEETIVKANGNIAFNIAIKNTIYDEKKLEEASQYLTKGHHAHTSLIQQEASGEKVEFSLIITSADAIGILYFIACSQKKRKKKHNKVQHFTTF